MSRATITLVGRAHSLAFEHGTATWKIAVRMSAGGGPSDYSLQARQTRVLEQFEAMDEGQLIGVIAELPPARKRKPGVPLIAQRLELLGKP